jgi:AcrR family transcriptional regulator
MTLVTSPTEPQPAPSQQDSMRSRIADVAERLFRSMGYQKTAVADIARELGMSPANVYRFFPTKSAINEAIAERLLIGLAEGAEAIAAGPGSAEEKLMAIAEHFRASGFQLFFAEKRMHDMVAAAMTEHWGVIERYIAHLQIMIQGVVQAGMDSGEFAPGDAQAAALAFKQATVAWHHPMMLADCLRKGQTEEEMRAELCSTLGFVLAGLKRGIR